MQGMKDGAKGQNAENNKPREKEKERKTEADRETDKSECHEVGEIEKVFDGRTRQQEEGGRKGGRERQLSSCPSPHAARTPPWGDSYFKPLPCFIFPWLLQPDQSS